MREPGRFGGAGAPFAWLEINPSWWKLRASHTAKRIRLKIQWSEGPGSTWP